MYKRAIINKLRSATDRYDYVIDNVIVDWYGHWLKHSCSYGIGKSKEWWKDWTVQLSGLSGQPACQGSRNWNKLEDGAREQPPKIKFGRHCKGLGRDNPFLEWADLVITVVVTFLEGCNFESFFTANNYGVCSCWSSQTIIEFCKSLEILNYWKYFRNPFIVFLISERLDCVNFDFLFDYQLLWKSRHRMVGIRQRHLLPKNQV